MTFSELVGAVLQTATRAVVARSRRNALDALDALEARNLASRDSREVLLALTAAVSPAPDPTTRRSA